MSQDEADEQRLLFTGRSLLRGDLLVRVGDGEVCEVRPLQRASRSGSGQRRRADAHVRGPRAQGSTPARER